MDKVLIDTSIWITFFRGKDKSVVGEVSGLLQKGQAVMAGVVLMELLQGALNEKELEKMLTLLEPVERVDPTSRQWEEAGRFSYRLRKKGATTSTVDALLALLAIENDCRLYTEDGHFKIVEKNSDLRLYLTLAESDS